MKKATEEKVRKEKKVNKINKDNKRKIRRSEKESEKELDDVELEDSDAHDDEDDDDDIIDRKKSNKKSVKRKKKFIIITAVIIIIIVLIIGLWGMRGGKSYPTVSEIVNNKDKYLDDYIEVKGSVKKDSVDFTNKTFNITDGKNNLIINYSDSLPSGFEEGKDVVVKGTLREIPSLGLVVEVKEIEVGCASKY